MAKRRRKATAPRRRRTTTAPRRRRGRRRGRGGGGGGLRSLPLTLAVSAAVGWAESKSKSDASFVLNKIPKFVDQLGWMGNTALALFVASKFIRNRWLSLAAMETARIAAYQLGRKGGTFAQSGEFFTVSGWSDGDVARVLDQYSAGALSAEGMPGVAPYDPSELTQFGEYGG